MKHIAIVTDSTANIPPELAAEYDITVIPLNIHWGEDTYKDGVTLDTSTFYQMLQERKDFPQTSQPSIGDFITLFQDVAARHETDTILGVFISSPLSGTLASASQAKAELPDLNIELVDSRSISMGLGFQALTAARLAQEGAAVEEILKGVHHVRASTELLIALDTLEYLHRGGRIGGAQRLLGTVLNFKPLLTLENGKIEALGKARSRHKSLQMFVELAEERLAGRRPAELAIMHVEGNGDVDYLTEMVNERLQPKRLYTGQISPVLGTHGGPGAIAMAFYTNNGV
ncbi:MAG TPA: DegV family protein [Chloroflexi bacterium]|nr:DegV family protein [Chloroflexota bacterium]